MVNCKNCNKSFDLNDYDICPYCGEEPEKKDEKGKKISLGKKTEKAEPLNKERDKPADNKLKFLIVGAAAVVIVVVAISAIFALGNSDITVPDQYSTIQEAIDAAEDGDVIVIDEGVYQENIDFRGKNIILTSTDPDNPAVVDRTIIDGGGSGAVVSFRSGESEEAVLRGFTLTRGGGLLISGGSSPVIEKNIIENNEAEVGAGIAIFDSSPTIIDNKIIGNSGYLGGGIYMEESSPFVENNMIQRNRAVHGSGVVIYSNSSPVMINNSIFDNTAEHLGGGLLVAIDSRPSIEGNAITDNTAGHGGGIYIEDSEPIIDQNTISGNKATNGGGLYLFNSLYASLLVTGNEISNNFAFNDGGGLYIKDSSPTIEDNNIVDNISENLGGGAAVYNSTLVLIRNVFEKNQADRDQGGGAIWLSKDSELDLEIPDDNIYTNNDPDDIFEE